MLEAGFACYPQLEPDSKSMMKTKLTLFVTVLAFCFQCELTGANLKKGLVAYYPFNGHSLDESGNGHHGGVSGATLATDRNGKKNRAYSFDGQDDYIQIIKHLPDMKAVTVSAWINKRDEKTAFVFSDSTSVSHNDFMLAVGKNVIGIRADKSGASLGYKTVPRGGGFTNVGENLPKRTWLMIAWVMNPYKSHIFIDGQLIATVDATGSNIGYHRARIGSDPHYRTAYAFKGSIDDVRIYNRALSAKEVKALYKLEKPKGQ